VVVVVSKNECEAKAMKSLFLFIPMCIVFGFLNEWGKLNVNFYLRITAEDHWNDYSLDQKKLIVSEEMAKLKTAYYFQLVEKESFISMTRSDWMYWKWIVPITGTIIFFILEWFFLPLIFSGNGISRVYIIYYYSFVFFLVGMMFMLFKVTDHHSCLTLARRIWLILQSPSLFVLLWCYQLIKRNE
jgi:hypothetical protein